MQRILATGICVQNVRSACKLFAAVYDTSMSNRTFAPLILSYYRHLGDPKIALRRGGGGGWHGHRQKAAGCWVIVVE